MRRIFFGAMASVLLLAGSANATILVGTFVSTPAETIPEINQLIANYNTEYGTSLSAVVALLDKVEGESSAGFTEGNLTLGDFDFFVESGVSGTESLSIFGTTVNFNASTLGATDGFDDLDAPVQGFKQLSGPSFEYYVSKDGRDGWSLWTHMTGLNPVYVDTGLLDSSLTSTMPPVTDADTGFSRGAINLTTNPNGGPNSYDPGTRGISHISFYSALPEDPDTVIPEPATMAIWGMLTGFATLFGYRKRKLATVTA